MNQPLPRPPEQAINKPRERHLLIAFATIVIVANVLGVAGAVAQMPDLVYYAGSLGVVVGALTFLCLYIRARTTRHSAEAFADTRFAAPASTSPGADNVTRK